METWDSFLTNLRKAFAKQEKLKKEIERLEANERIDPMFKEALDIKSVETPLKEKKELYYKLNDLIIKKIEDRIEYERKQDGFNKSK